MAQQRVNSPAPGQVGGWAFISVLLVGSLATWIPVAVIALVSAAVFRGGLALRLVGVAIVTRAGAEASRLRAFGRALLAWAPVALSLPLLALASVVLPALGLAIAPPTVAFFIASVMGLLFTVGTIWAVANPARGLQDRIAGTYLVPR